MKTSTLEEDYLVCEKCDNTKIIYGSVKLCMHKFYVLNMKGCH